MRCFTDILKRLHSLPLVASHLDMYIVMYNVLAMYICMINMGINYGRIVILKHEIII